METPLVVVDSKHYLIIPMKPSVNLFGFQAACVIKGILKPFLK